KPQKKDDDRRRTNPGQGFWQEMEHHDRKRRRQRKSAHGSHPRGVSLGNEREQRPKDNAENNDEKRPKHGDRDLDLVADKVQAQNAHFEAGNGSESRNCRKQAPLRVPTTLSRPPPGGLCL